MGMELLQVTGIPDLQRIKDMRIDDLWMGLETDREESIKYINKGHPLADAYE